MKRISAGSYIIRQRSFRVAIDLVQHEYHQRPAVHRVARADGEWRCLCHFGDARISEQGPCAAARAPGKRKWHRVLATVHEDKDRSLRAKLRDSGSLRAAIQCKWHRAMAATVLEDQDCSFSAALPDSGGLREAI